MARPTKVISDFDVKLGAVIAGRRAKKGKMSQRQLAKLAGIPISNIQRREDGTNEFTVSELERVAAVFKTTAADIVQEALNDYGGLEKLIAEYAPADPVSDAAPSVEDNVTYIGRVTPPESAAADTKDRVPPKD